MLILEVYILAINIPWFRKIKTEKKRKGRHESEESLLKQGVFFCLECVGEFVSNNADSARIQLKRRGIRRRRRRRSRRRRKRKTLKIMMNESGVNTTIRISSILCFNFTTVAFVICIIDKFHSLLFIKHNEAE